MPSDYTIGRFGIYIHCLYMYNYVGNEMFARDKPYWEA